MVVDAYVFKGKQSLHLEAEVPVSSETSGTARPTTQRHVRDVLCLPDVSNGSGCGQVEWQVFVNTVMNLRVTYKTGNFVSR